MTISSLGFIDLFFLRITISCTCISFSVVHWPEWLYIHQSLATALLFLNLCHRRHKSFLDVC